MQADRAIEGTGVIETDIPARLDRLPWSRWHLRVIVALSVTWLLDGLEGSLGGSLAGALKSKEGLNLSDAQLGLSSSFYLAGAVCGALIFGYMADQYGRRRLFFWTLAIYLFATAASGLSWSLASFTFFRVLTGAGIGGEYAAINSAVDELIPARMRGRIDLWINGTFWLGIILGALISVAFLSHSFFSTIPGWRLAFFSGMPIGLVVLWMRRYIPESPRWLLGQGALQQARAIVVQIESTIPAKIRPPTGTLLLTEVGVHTESSPRRLIKLLAGQYRKRAILCFTLMTAQAFFYNSVFFSLSLVLMRYYGVPKEDVGYLFIPISITNFLGPVLLGYFFDSVGRRKMIAATYCLSGFTLLVASWLFLHNHLSTTSQIAWWSTIFFFASTAASSAYLTVSEVFPQPMRATSIAFFYAFGTLAGGVFGPLIFGHLIGDSSRTPLFIGYAMGAAAMIAAGLIQAVWGVSAEGKSLESLAPANS